jgi:hypothetical protein
MSQRYRVAAFLSLLASLGAAGPAAAQSIGAHAETGGGGASTANGTTHFSAAGLGMAVGRTDGGGITVYHGFLARAIATRDTLPPVFDPPPANIAVQIPAGAAQCSVTVMTPAIRVRDNRDPHPQVTATLRANPVVNLNPAGDQVDLGVGSYDVVVTATDRRGNTSQTTYRIDVTDHTAPVIAPVPNPTPVGAEAEAASPAGTPVPLGNYACRDVCDPHPVLASNELARYPLGDTNVTITCRDASGNQAQSVVPVRVRDRSAPSIAGDAPADVLRECNNPAGSTVAVPQLVWQDNGYSANQLQISLVVDPAGANRQFNPIPDQVVLTGGAHVLRFIARDPAGNQRAVDMNVTVADRQAPRIEVIDAPQLGWYRQGANVRLRITDGCSSLADGIQVNVQPAPAQRQQLDANTLQLTYNGDGIYNLNLTVTDSAGNQANDNSIGFGIDSTPPVPAVVTPTQQGLVDANRLTWPVYAQAELMPLNVGGNEPGDGIQSGVRRVQVILDPDNNGNGHTLVDQSFNGNGNPQRGQRVVGNVRCTDTAGNNPYCNQDGQIDLRHVRVGFHTLRVLVTDFAGNQSVEDAKFTNANLEFGLDIVSGKVNARVQRGGLAAAAAAQLQSAVPKLNRGRDVANMVIAGSPYDTPVFLGGALKAVQDATINFQEAINDAAAADQPEIRDMVALLHRIAWSDLLLYREYIDSLDIPARIPAQDQGWELPDWGADMDAGAASLDAMLDAIDAEQWSQSAQDALDSFFSHKLAETLWEMDVRLEPSPGFNYTPEYTRARRVLAGIRDELNLYLRLDTKPAEANMTDIRDRLNRVIAALDRLLQVGFDQPMGLSDSDYLLALLEVQAIGNSSVTANSQGAWVRNYQFSIMQVVRWMTHASTKNALYWISADMADAQHWNLFQAALGRIANGVQLLLPPRRVEQAVQFYGASDTQCLIVAVYHCYYISDEGRADMDQPYAGLPANSPCWNNMLRPDEWAHARVDANLPPPQCRWGADLAQGR